VPGYSLFQGYRYLVTEGLRYQPDLVVLTFGWNDSGMWDHLGDRDHHAALQAMRPPSLLRHSRVCQLIWGHWNKPVAGGAGQKERPRLSPSEFAETLEQIRAVLEPRHIPLLILVWPMKMNADPSIPADARTPLQTEMMTFGKAHPLATEPPIDGVLDLCPLGRELVGTHGVGAVYYDHGHVTPLGHRAIAEAIADHLAPWLGK
jgi:lysophospholipase L1-like esterase